METPTYSYSTDAEVFRGNFATRQAAIEAGFAAARASGDFVPGMVITTCVHPDQTHPIGAEVSIDNVVEPMTHVYAASSPTFSYSMDGEMFVGESFPSREEALAAGMAEASHESSSRSVVYVGRHEDPAQARDFLPSASDFLVYVQERAGDEIGECTDGWLIGVTDEQEAQVQVHLDAIAELIQAFDPPHFHLVVDIETHTGPEA